MKSNKSGVTVAFNYDKWFEAHTGHDNDVVKVIRCKDCKYYNPQQHYCEGIGNWFGYVGEWSDNGYCYKAERKEE